MISPNKSLKPFNTFGIDANSEGFATFSSVDELRSVIEECKDSELLILGGGSNLLFTKDFEGVVLKNEIKGIEIIHEDDAGVLIKAGSGEVWHEFVLACIDKGLGGIENLSLIPGSVGASPMQNIGAYGVEIKDVFHELEAFHIESGEVHTFSKEQCQFGYRESVFKRALKGQYIITSVTYRLSRKHDINSSYGAIEQELSNMGVASPTIRDISEAVITIRSSKLPDPNEIGNAGSFFKNPVVEPEVLAKIQKEYANVPNYPAPNGKIKLAAGWLIDQAGWKGKTFKNYGVHKMQALVLVNYGGCSGKDIFNLSEEIIQDIHQKFGVILEREVNII